MASDELKPCPFCGGKADPVRHAGRPAATPVCFYIECLTCRAASRWVKNLNEAAADWNRRAQDFDAMRQRAEKAELEAALDLAEGLRALLPDLDDALEDLELHGCHDQQGYRKLKDWFRKVEIHARVIDAALAKQP